MEKQDEVFLDKMIDIDLSGDERNEQIDFKSIFYNIKAEVEQCREDAREAYKTNEKLELIYAQKVAFGQYQAFSRIRNSIVSIEQSLDLNNSKLISAQYDEAKTVVNEMIK